MSTSLLDEPLAGSSGIGKLAVQIDAYGHVDGSVGDLGVADLDHDRVDQQHRVEPIQRPVLPREHVLDNRVGDLGDRLSADLSAIELEQMRLDVTRREPLGVERDPLR